MMLCQIYAFRLGEVCDVHRFETEENFTIIQNLDGLLNCESFSVFNRNLRYSRDPSCSLRECVNYIRQSRSSSWTTSSGSACLESKRRVTAVTVAAFQKRLLVGRERSRPLRHLLHLLLARCPISSEMRQSVLQLDDPRLQPHTLGTAL